MPPIPPIDPLPPLAGQARDEQAGAALQQTIELLQQGRIGMAMNHLREALLLSDSQATRQLLAGPVVQGFESLFKALLRALQQSQQNPGDANTRAALMGFRRELASGWLSLPDALVQRIHAMGAGNLQNLIGPACRFEAVDADDQAIVNQLNAFAWAQPTPAAGFVQHLLAVMLYCRADQVPGSLDLPRVPPWLLSEYVNYVLDPPAIFQQVGEAESYTKFLIRWADYLTAALAANPDSPGWKQIAVQFASRVNFIAAYFNYLNLKDLYVKRARLVENVFRSLGHQVDCTFPPRDPSRRKIRLGILSAHYTPQTETFATLPVYMDIDRERFEVVLLSLNNTNHALERFCISRADSFVFLSGDLPQQVQKIRSLDLDMVFLATNVTAVINGITMLAAHRLARVQVASVCSCVTTGMQHVDCYLSGTLTEPPNAQEQYKERLVMIDGPAHCYNFGPAESKTPAQSLSRGALNIPADAVVFASGANFYKILPELDELWAKILAQTPGSRLILYPFNPNWSNSYPAGAFTRRIYTTMARHGVSQDRLLIFGMAPGRADVMERLRLANVYLDSWPFAGVTSLLDPLELGMPSIVKDGNSFRSLIGPALLRDLKLEEFIAADDQAYVDIAVKLAKDKQFRDDSQWRFTEAMAKNPRFLDTKSYAQRVGDALEGAWKTHLAEQAK